MSGASVRVYTGVCDCTSHVAAVAEEEPFVRIAVSSACEHVNRMVSQFIRIDACLELQQGYDGAIFRAAREHLKAHCTACAVPGAIFKAVQVAAGSTRPRTMLVDLECWDCIKLSE